MARGMKLSALGHHVNPAAFLGRSVTIFKGYTGVWALGSTICMAGIILDAFESEHVVILRLVFVT